MPSRRLGETESVEEESIGQKEELEKRISSRGTLAMEYDRNVKLR